MNSLRKAQVEPVLANVVTRSPIQESEPGNT